MQLAWSVTCMKRKQTIIYCVATLGAVYGGGCLMITSYVITFHGAGKHASIIAANITAINVNITHGNIILLEILFIDNK